MRHGWLVTIVLWTLIARASWSEGSERFLVSIPSDPPGAQVYHNGQLLGSTDQPVDVSFPPETAEVKLDLVLKGHLTTALVLNRVDAQQQRVPTLTVLKPASWGVAIRDSVRRHPRAWSGSLLTVAVALGLMAWGVRSALRAARENRELRDLAARLPGDPWVGKLVGGYRLTRPLGKGGFGVVYEGLPAGCWDPDRAVAVKLMLNPTEEDRSRLHREVAIVRTLRHRHIVPLLGWGEHEGALYLVYALVRGETVRAGLEAGAGQGLSLERAWSLLEPVLEAVDYAHSQKVVHRDLKPENLMVDDRGRLQVLDFGGARSESSQTITVAGEARGTIPYMAPEFLMSEGEAKFSMEFFARVDQYAVGVIAYELLSGTLPFHEQDALQTALKAMTEPVPPLRQRCGGVPPAVEDVVMRMLEKDPALRYPDLRQATTAWREALRQQVPA